MNLKNLYRISKINIYSKFLNNLILKIYNNSIIGWLFCISLILTFPTLSIFILGKNIFTDSFVNFLLLLCSISSCVSGLLGILFTITIVVDFLLENFIKEKIYNKLNFNIPEYNTDILTHLIYQKHKNNKTHTSSNLNLEIEKLSQAFDNKSNIYKNLSETDFPYINKFIRRVLQVQSGCKLSNSSNIEQLELISPEDIDKLNMDLSKVIPSNPKLLTLDSMDNELNNIIHNQIKNLNKENVELY